MPPRTKKGLLPVIALFATAALAITGILYVHRFQRLRQEPLRAFETPAPTPAPVQEGLVQKQVVQVPVAMRLPAPTPEPARVLGGSTINIVLMGLDSNLEREEQGKGWRSDTIAILVIDVEKPACTVVHVPRDTRAKVQKLNKSGKVISRKYNKINSAFQYGGGPQEQGHENLIWSLEALLFDGLSADVNMGYYISIDMDAIERFADAVGGVPITLPYDMPGYGKEGEEIVLQGEYARKFVRLRHGITGGSDIGRIERQKEFIRAFAARVQALGAKEAVPRLWGALGGCMHTNLSTEQVLVLADLLSRLNVSGVAFLTLPGSCKTIEGRSYYAPHVKEVRALAMQLWG